MMRGVIEEIRKEIEKVLELNENENTTYQNLYDTAKSVLRGKFIHMNAYIKSIERSQINDQMLYLKLLENKEQAKPKTNRRREIIKRRAGINKTKMEKSYKESMKQKADSLKRQKKSTNPWEI
jgi:hypothetical protein